MIISATICLQLLLQPEASSKSKPLPLLPPLRISGDGRNFINPDGSRFFWLGDTGWTMPTRLSLTEVDEYLKDRKKKGFTVIQVILVPWDARQGGNPEGQKPYLQDDMAQPNPLYFDYVEKILNKIEGEGFYAAVVPFWLAGLPEPGPSEVWKHRSYARYLGERFGHRNMFWLLGADRWPDGWADVIRAFAHQFARSSGRSDQLLTHHPAGGQSSSRFFHEENWMDFNLIQSGHNADLPAYKLTEVDYSKRPVKPVVDGEPAYENITNALVPYGPGVRLIDDYDVRRQAYQSVFSGAAGHTYGACEVYEFHREGMGKARWTVGVEWRKALQFPGASQLVHLKRLIESQSPLHLIPDSKLIVSPNPEDPNGRLAAIRHKDGHFAYIYSPKGLPFALDLTRLSGKGMTGSWMDLKTGVRTSIFAVSRAERVEFLPPKKGDREDSVLILDMKKS